MFERTFGCANGHRFDQARYGYLTLLDPRAPKTIGDDRAMLESRRELLARGAYGRIADAVARAVVDSRSIVSAPERGLSVADLGCGTGYYSASVMAHASVSRLLAADRSPDAVRMTLRALAGAVPVTGVVLDLWRPLPLRDASADVLIDVFAPRNPPEYARVLRQHGSLVVVVPTAAHLAGLRERAALLDIPGDKDIHVVERFERVGLLLSARDRIEYRLSTDASTRALIASMGPSAHHGAGRESTLDTASDEAGEARDFVVSVDVLTLTKP